MACRPGRLQMKCPRGSPRAATPTRASFVRPWSGYPAPAPNSLSGAIKSVVSNRRNICGGKSVIGHPFNSGPRIQTPKRGKNMSKRWISVLALALAAVAGCASDRTRQAGLERIEHIVVIYAENRSFDHLYGSFAGAEGIAQASAEQKTQLDLDGKPLPHLPAVYSGGKPNPKYPTAGMPNGPFRIDAPPINGRFDEVLPSPWHLYYQNREQIAGGKNNN